VTTQAREREINIAITRVILDFFECINSFLEWMITIILNDSSLKKGRGFLLILNNQGRAASLEFAEGPALLNLVDSRICHPERCEGSTRRSNGGNYDSAQNGVKESNPPKSEF
jgi:hypothetical protein